MRKRRKEKSIGLYVEVRNNNIEGALKKFKRKVKESGLMVELRDRQYYEKPSEKRRREKNLSKSRQKYKVIKEKKHY